MILTFTKAFRLALLLVSVQAYAQGPAIQSLTPNVQLVWTNPIAGNISEIQHSTNLLGPWSTVTYDWATNGTLLTRLPPAGTDHSFYRIQVQTSIPDPSLILHLPFDNYFADGTVLDVSGHGNHGLRYGRPSSPTNWPSSILGPDGSRAAEFHWYLDGYGLYGKSGDYVGIRYSPTLANLTEATVGVWVHYYRSLNGDINNDQNSSILDTGQNVPGAFNFGRNYSASTTLIIWTGSGTAIEALRFPDNAPDGDSGGWHYYAFTFSHGLVRGYFDGIPFRAVSSSIESLTVAGYYMAIAGWTFNATPEMDLSIDGHPNNAWINGSVDDVRIYNRALDASEIATLYHSFDKLPPTTPTNLEATVNSANQVAVRWRSSKDLYGVAGYLLRRNGVTLVTTTNLLYFDGGLLPETTNVYTIQAFDFIGNYSMESSPVSVTTLAAGSPVTLIVDDADGPPWVTPEGLTPWQTFATLPGYYGAGFLSDEKTDKGSKTVTFRPSIPEAGTYKVYVRFPGRDDISFLFADNVPVRVTHDGATSTVRFSEQANFGVWNFLGAFPFSAGTNDVIQLGTDGTSGYVFADAFMLVK